MKHKHVKIQIKATGDNAGEFEGYAAVFNNTDLGGDIIMPGAFAKTIKENPEVPVLWGHNSREVIGVNQTWEEDSKGLKIKGKLVLDVQRGKEAYSLLKENAVKGLSIGYDPIIADYRQQDDEWIRILRECKVWEYSLTPFPMNPEAQITDVKSVGDFEASLHELMSLCKKAPETLSKDSNAMLDAAIKQLSALRAAKAPEAAMQNNLAPAIHAMSKQFEFLKA